MSPVIMNSSFDRLDMDNVFVAIKGNLENFDVIMQGLVASNLEGYVFTMPVKEVALRYMDELSEEAEIIGAVNCACLREGRIIGYNTDSLGFWNAVNEARDETQEKIQKVFILGAGGMARAAAAQAALQGVKEIVVSNKFTEIHFMESFNAFIKRLKTKVPSVNIKVIDWKTDEWEQELPSCRLIANCTPNGMGGEGRFGGYFSI